MSKKSLNAKIDFMLEMCENIEEITKRHCGIVKTLEDFEGQMAVLMGLSQIGETLKKLDDEIVVKYDLVKDKEGAYYTRNYIVHDYEGVDLGFIENILRVYLPTLKNKIVSMQNDYN
ncbi:MAG: HepT-like ribonuclease domain-containing protein [Campylobacterota bacterium]